MFDSELHILLYVVSNFSSLRSCLFVMIQFTITINLISETTLQAGEKIHLVNVGILIGMFKD